MYNYNYSINEQFTMIIGYRNGRLTWHNGIIPATEIWVKIGGDKGGGSFKFNFQIVNTISPNSVQNTCVFSCFEASDSYMNLHMILNRYQTQIKFIESMTWRYVHACIVQIIVTVAPNVGIIHFVFFSEVIMSLSVKHMDSQVPVVGFYNVCCTQITKYFHQDDIHAHFVKLLANR